MSGGGGDNEGRCLVDLDGEHVRCLDVARVVRGEVGESCLSLGVDREVNGRTARLGRRDCLCAVGAVAYPLDARAAAVVCGVERYRHITRVPAVVASGTVKVGVGCRRGRICDRLP